MWEAPRLVNHQGLGPEPGIPPLLEPRQGGPETRRGRENLGGKVNDLSIVPVIQYLFCFRLVNTLRKASAEMHWSAILI